MASKTQGEIACTVARNLIKAYGRPKFVKLLEMIRSNSPGPKIAAEFQVSRQRVHQWKSHLGEELVTFKLHPEVEQLLGITTQSRTRV